MTEIGPIRIDADSKEKLVSQLTAAFKYMDLKCDDSSAYRDLYCLVRKWWFHDR